MIVSVRRLAPWRWFALPARSLREARPSPTKPQPREGLLSGLERMVGHQVDLVMKSDL